MKALIGLFLLVFHDAGEGRNDFTLFFDLLNAESVRLSKVVRSQIDFRLGINQLNYDLWDFVGMEGLCGVLIDVIVLLDQVEFLINVLQHEFEQLGKNWDSISEFWQVFYFYEPFISVDEVRADFKNSILDQFEILKC